MLLPLRHARLRHLRVAATLLMPLPIVCDVYAACFAITLSLAAATLVMRERRGSHYFAPLSIRRRFEIAIVDAADATPPLPLKDTAAFAAAAATFSDDMATPITWRHTRLRAPCAYAQPYVCRARLRHLATRYNILIFTCERAARMITSFLLRFFTRHMRLYA